MNSETEIKNICYACGLELRDYPYDPETLTPNPEAICPCCGIHYGYDDEGAGSIISDELAYSGWKFGDTNHKKIMKIWREHWINDGMKWKHNDPVSLSERPINWNPKKQLENIPEHFR